MDRSAFEEQLRQAGFDEVLTKDLEANGRLGRHEHPWDVHGLVLGGEFTIATAEASRTYRTGETFYLPAGVPHEEGQGPEGARLLLGRRRKAGQAAG